MNDVVITISVGILGYVLGFITCYNSISKQLIEVKRLFSLSQKEKQLHELIISVLTDRIKYLEKDEKGVK